jgi:hypothetical protein
MHWPLHPQENTPHTHRIGGWVGPLISLGAEGNGNTLCPDWNLTPGHLGHSLSHPND